MPDTVPYARQLTIIQSYPAETSRPAHKHPTKKRTRIQSFLFQHHIYNMPAPTALQKPETVAEPVPENIAGD